MNQVPRIRLYLWPHRLLLLGPMGDTDCHRHHAAQLCISLSDEPVRMRSTQGEELRSAPSFFVPPDVSHQLDNAEKPMAMLYLDPEGPECERACQRFGHEGISALREDSLPSGSLQRLASLRDGVTEADWLCRELLGFPKVGERVVDERLRRALAWLDERVDDDVRLSDLARAANTSESWLTHNFAEAIGIPVRRYVLWRRLRRALEAAMTGTSLTQAAHSAGFSDSAHLSRTFRATFGVTPSFLFAKRDRLSVATFKDDGTKVSI